MHVFGMERLAARLQRRRHEHRVMDRELVAPDQIEPQKSKIRRQSLDLPVAVAGGIEPAAAAFLSFAGSGRLVDRQAAGFGFGQGALGGGGRVALWQVVSSLIGVPSGQVPLPGTPGHPILWWS